MIVSKQKSYEPINILLENEDETNAVLLALKFTLQENTCNCSDSHLIKILLQKLEYLIEDK